jgi:hypothetical protein
MAAEDWEEGREIDFKTTLISNLVFQNATVR